MRKKLLILIICVSLLFTNISHIFPSIIKASNFKNENNALKLLDSITKEPSKEYSKNNYEKNQLSFGAFADTHIGARYQYPYLLYGYKSADFLDKIANDLLEHTGNIDFVVHLGDIINHNTAHVNGVGLPCYVNQYKNNLKKYLISKVNLPFHFVIGNHDMNDYDLNPDNPHILVQSLIDEICMNSPVYAMMRDGILFLVIPELGYVQWTHPVLYQWIEYMTGLYKDSTTVILCHQAIEDTTKDPNNNIYHGKQDFNWWANLFRENPQIIMWIHGHNHYLDWYVNNQSSGESCAVQFFDHDIAFSSPYPQLDLYRSFEEDRIVIYNISADKISTATWENNGLRGHWVSDFTHTWNVHTSFDPNSEDWYAFSMFLQDNETQLTDMKVISPNIELHLIGTKPMELFYDSKLESPGQRVKILGFGNDRSDNVIWDDPGIKVLGPSFITFPEKYPLDNNNHEDGRSGPLYQSFPMGTICAAVPGARYNFTITARCNSGLGRIFLNVSCCDWNTRSQYSVLAESESQIISEIIGPDYQTIHGIYTVPDNENAWFLQGVLNFPNSSDYEISIFSVRRDCNSDKTENFHVRLGDHWYNSSGVLDAYEYNCFPININNLADEEGIMNFKATIDGNKFGMVNIVYYEPVILCRNARFFVESYADHAFNLTLTKTTSKCSHKFKIIPFSNDKIYDFLNILSEDGSGVRHSSKNGNIWLTCNCPDIDDKKVKFSFRGGLIVKPERNCIYINDREIGSTFIVNTIIIGDISVRTNVDDVINVSKVEFFVDDKLQFEDTEFPFEWIWDKISFSKHGLKVLTYYNNGFISEDNMNLFKFL
jgi:hypothetical protein